MTLFDLRISFFLGFSGAFNKLFVQGIQFSLMLISHNFLFSFILFWVVNRLGLVLLFGIFLLFWTSRRRLLYVCGNFFWFSIFFIVCRKNALSLSLIVQNSTSFGFRLRSRLWSRHFNFWRLTDIRHGN